MIRPLLLALLLAVSLSPALLLSSCLTGGEDSARSPVPVHMYGASAGVGSAGIHTVGAGETLWRISQAYKLPMRGIIHANRLEAPYILDIGQRLKLPPPLEYRVRAGDTLYGVSRLFNVGINDVARVNNLRSPYTVRVGQVLRLPAVGGEPAAAAKTRTKTPSASRDGETGTPPPARKPAAKSAGRTPVTKAPPRRSGSRFKWPVSGKVISTYGPKKDGLHNDGINIKVPKGTPVRAAENGVVVYAGNELKGYGNLVLIRHDNRWMTAYGHLGKFTIKRGQTVKVGQTIGTVGSSGSVDTPQLHFEVRKGTDALNPQRYLE